MRKELQTIDQKSLMKLEDIVLNEMLTVADVKQIIKEKKFGYNSMSGLKFVLDHDPNLKGTIKRNELTGQIDIVGKMPWKRRGVHLTDTDTYNLALYIEENYELGDKNLNKVLDIVANNNSFHPIREYLAVLKWDGIPRIENALHHFLGAEKNSYTAAVMQMHMLAAIKRVYFPGCKYDIMLCLVGGQGIGKSTFFRYLAIKDEWFTDDVKSLEDKKVYEYLQGHWIVEMAEMHAVTNGKSIEGTKSFITRQKDVYRIPYEKRAEDRERQCVFCGTSNDLSFLPYDRTGNRRFAPVKTNASAVEQKIYEDEAYSRKYICQMWAEAMEIFRQGKYELTFSEEMESFVKNLQKEFMPEDTQAGMIQQFLDNYDGDYVCTMIIYQEVFDGTGVPPSWKSKEVGEIMNNDIYGWEKCKSNHRFGKGIGSQRAWKRVKTTPDEDGFVFVTDDMEIPFK